MLVKSCVGFTDGTGSLEGESIHPVERAAFRVDSEDTQKMYRDQDRGVVMP